MTTYTSNLESSSANNDNQTRLLCNRIDIIEKHLIDIYASLCAYIRRIAKLRDEGDLLSNQIFNFAESEKLNTTMKHCLENFAEKLYELQDHRHAEIQRLELKVIDEISQYGDLIRKTKEETKSNNSARNKYLNQIKESSRNSLLNEISSTQKAFEIQVERFESRKNHDFKRFFLDFAKIELQYHLKGVEIMTKAYKDILSIDEDADLKEFCNNFNIISSSQNLGKKRFPSHSSLDLDNKDKSSETIPALRRFYSNPSFIDSSNSKMKKNWEKNDDDKKDYDNEDDDNDDDDDEDDDDDDNVGDDNKDNNNKTSKEKKTTKSIEASDESSDESEKITKKTNK